MLIDENRKISLSDLIIYIATKIYKKFPLLILSAATGVFTEIVVALFSHSTISIINCLLGAFAGCCVFCTVFCLFYIFSETVNTAEELADITGCNSVTFISDSVKKKGISGKLNTIRFGKSNFIPIDEQLNFLSAYIELSLKSSSATKLCIIGSVEEKTTGLIAETVKSAAANAKCDTYLIDDENISSHLIQQLSETATAIFIEEIHNTSYRKIQSSKELCEKYNIPVICSVAVFR